MAEETAQNNENIEPKTTPSSQFLDEGGLRQFTAKIKAYIDKKYRITNVVIGTDVIDITIE